MVNLPRNPVVKLSEFSITAGNRQKENGMVSAKNHLSGS